MIYEKLSNGSLHLTDHIPMDYINYWGGVRSTIEEQRWNVEKYIPEGNTESKVESIVKNLKGRSILEIGCAPASLLKVCMSKKMRCVGIEPDPQYIDNLKEYSGAKNIINGYFPEVDLQGQKFDNIVALDVFEHIEDGQAFVDACREHLTEKGQIIFMIPFAEDGEEFQINEHIWLYSRQHIEEWLKPVKIETWAKGHNIIIFK